MKPAGQPAICAAYAAIAESLQACLEASSVKAVLALYSRMHWTQRTVAHHEWLPA